VARSGVDPGLRCRFVELPSRDAHVLVGGINHVFNGDPRVGRHGNPQLNLADMAPTRPPQRRTGVQADSNTASIAEWSLSRSSRQLWK
jgi:hypothetical protein